jgi:hypothetical protein
MRMNGKISFKARMNLKCGMAKPTAQPPRTPKQQPNMQRILIVLMIIVLIKNPNDTTFTDLINPDSECYYSSDQTNRANRD